MSSQSLPVHCCAARQTEPKIHCNGKNVRWQAGRQTDREKDRQAETVQQQHNLATNRQRKWGRGRKRERDRSVGVVAAEEEVEMPMLKSVLLFPSPLMLLLLLVTGGGGQLTVEYSSHCSSLSACSRPDVHSDHWLDGWLTSSFIASFLSDFGCCCFCNRRALLSPACRRRRRRRRRFVFIVIVAIPGSWLTHSLSWQCSDCGQPASQSVSVFTHCAAAAAALDCHSLQAVTGNSSVADPLSLDSAKVKRYTVPLRSTATAMMMIVVRSATTFLYGTDAHTCSKLRLEVVWWWHQ